MSKRYTREELAAIGMSDVQIDAILDTYAKEDDAAKRGFSVLTSSVEQSFNEDTHVKELRVTTISELKGYTTGNIVELPPFGVGQPFVARLTRPSLLLLAKEGKIPNSLMKMAMQLFTGNKSNAPIKDADVMMREMYDVCMIVCKASLLEPTFDELIEAGIKLSDDQITAIFNYTQMGVKALSSFREI